MLSALASSTPSGSFGSVVENADMAKDSGAPVRIAHVINNLKIGGMENGLVNLVNRLPPNQFEHSIVCLADSSDFERRITNPDVRVFSLHKKPGKDPALYKRYMRLLRAIRPDVVHTRNFGTIDLAPISALAGVPVRIHGEHGWNAADPRGQSRKYRLLRRLCHPLIHGYSAVSKDIAHWLAETLSIDPTTITHICNGVDTERFNPAVAPAPLALDADEPFVIGTVGRLDPIKNHGWLLKTFAQLRDTRPDLAARLCLVIAGEGPSRGCIEHDIASRHLDGHVQLLGSREDVPAVLRSFDVFVLPSLNEGISNTVLEAMASGLPVIASDVGGNPELIRPGETGQLVTLGDTDRFAAMLAQYVDNPALLQTHGARARTAAEVEFSLDRMVSSYAALYATAVAERRRAA